MKRTYLRSFIGLGFLLSSLGAAFAQHDAAEILGETALQNLL